MPARLLHALRSAVPPRDADGPDSETASPSDPGPRPAQTASRRRTARRCYIRWALVPAHDWCYRPRANSDGLPARYARETAATIGRIVRKYGPTGGGTTHRRTDSTRALGATERPQMAGAGRSGPMQPFRRTPRSRSRAGSASHDWVPSGDSGLVARRALGWRPRVGTGRRLDATRGPGRPDARPGRRQFPRSFLAAIAAPDRSHLADATPNRGRAEHRGAAGCSLLGRSPGADQS
jgi:hypothetical protein